MRGYQKKIIYIKNTGSTLFEEAYFVLRPDTDNKGKNKVDMVSEANKIIKENFGCKKSGFLSLHKEGFIAFFIGVVITLAISLIVFL